ncbi:MAG: GTPase HflX, partial [Candidatus Omnitrophica bacterium]|nr:GTPase HflX [Candidatus Omnitrophota bacterium]
EKNTWPRTDIVKELEELVRAANVEPSGKIFCLRDKPTPDLFIGKGKAEEINLFTQAEDIDSVIFSHDLSGTQQRNLEEIIGKKTIDRTQLILDIFSRHARSPEGNTQVELAQLEYLLPRLAGKGIMLSRLGGGIGTRGPGEQKLEIDRRRINKRIFKLKEDLKHLSGHRNLLRKKRKEENIFCIALVGYTNAGKSTLLNSLTNAGQHVENSLFTTLDPLSRRMSLPSGAKVIISDTVGFLHHLPHHLIDAFHATLEEVIEADLLIHVLDSNHPRIQEQGKAVFEVLEQLKCADKPIVTVLNKIDLQQDRAMLGWMQERFLNSIFISAKTKENIEGLIEVIESYCNPRMTSIKLSIPLNRMDLVDYLYRNAKVKSKKFDAKSVSLEININNNLLPNLLRNKEIEIIS